MKSILYLSFAPLLVLAAACQPDEPDGQDREPAAPDTTGQAQAQEREQVPAAATAPEQNAFAEISATEGNDAAGTVRFTTAGDTVRVEGRITGLEPGAHGLHIHAQGDCSAPDASSAGGHYAPDDDPHGSPRDLPDEHHVGDLGNIVADSDGTAEVNAEDPEIALSGPESVVGRAVIVHSGRDDLESQPSGDAGARVGCGVIELASNAGAAGQDRAGGPSGTTSGGGDT